MTETILQPSERRRLERDKRRAHRRAVDRDLARMRRLEQDEKDAAMLDKPLMPSELRRKAKRDAVDPRAWANDRLARELDERLELRYPKGERLQARVETLERRRASRPERYARRTRR